MASRIKPVKRPRHVQARTWPENQHHKQQKAMAGANAPATLTAFTSRLGLQLSTEDRRGPGLTTKCYGDNHNNEANTREMVLSASHDTNCTYISGSAISFYSDDEYEDVDDDDYNEEVLVFKRIEVAKPTTRVSNLTLMLQGASGAEANSIRRSTSKSSSSSSSTRKCTFPNPLQCHPAYTTPPLTPPCGPQSPRSPPPPPPPSPFLLTPPVSMAGSPTLSSVASSVTGGSSQSSQPVIHIPQLASKHAFRHSAPRSMVDDSGADVLVVPFNGACGPRATPVVVLGQMKSAREIRSQSSLLPSELSSSLKTSIIDEHSSRYIFTHYGSRRCLEEDRENDNNTVAHCDMRRTSMRRTYSAPTIQQTTTTIEAVPIPRADNGKPPFLAEGDKLGPLRKIYYVDDYVPPRSWSWGMDYHSKGW